MNLCAGHLHQRHINTLWNWLMTHSDAGPFHVPPIILSLTPHDTHTHTHRANFSLENNWARSHSQWQPWPTPPFPVLLLLLLLTQCKSLMMMCCRGNGWRWAAPRAVGGTKPLSSVGGICRAHPSPSFWKEQEADCFWEGVGVGELSPLLPAASLGIACLSPFSFLPLFSALPLHVVKMQPLVGGFLHRIKLQSCCQFEKVRKKWDSTAACSHVHINGVFRWMPEI